MNKSDITRMPQYYDRYINLAMDRPLVKALQATGAEFLLEERAMLARLGDKVYAPGKWTAKDLLQHIIDTERVFSYRAMRIARNDKTPLPGFEENEYAVTAQATDRDLDDLLAEYAMLRNSVIFMFKSFTEEMLHREGVCSGKEISVLAIGFVIAGHTQHHVQKLQELYYPLIGG